LNQQRQPITETRYPIDQTIPHQLVISKILGALMCHPAFRIIQHDGARPFVTPTDALADLRGACDIAVSLDGSMNYGLVIEAKTTAHSDGGAWKIFKAVREERRNALQFERLVNAAPRWWYLIVRTDKLTAKTHEEHDRNLLDCPAILVDGKQGDQVPEDFIGPLRFGEMLQILGDRLHISSSTPIQQNKAESATYTLNDELKQRPARPPEDDQWSSDMSIPNESIFHIAPYVNRVVNNVGIETFIERATPSAVAVFEELKRISKSSNGFIDPYNSILHAVGYATRTRRGQREVEVAKHMISSEAILLGIAIATTTESNRLGAVGRELSRVFPEMLVTIKTSGSQKNAIISATHVALRSKR